MKKLLRLIGIIKCASCGDYKSTKNIAELSEKNNRIDHNICDMCFLITVARKFNEILDTAKKLGCAVDTAPDAADSVIKFMIANCEAKESS